MTKSTRARRVARAARAPVPVERLEDRRLMAATLVSVNASGLGAAGDGPSGATAAFGVTRPSVSADGRFVAFVSDATDLGESDENGATDVYVRDVETGATTAASINTAGTSLGNGPSGVTAAGDAGPRVSGNGRYVVFTSAASNLVPGDANNATDVFVRDLDTFQTILVSFNGANAGVGGGASSDAVISDDGLWVAFVSTAGDLVAGQADADGGLPDVFVRDMQNGVTERVSAPAAGGAGGGAADGAAGGPSISADGRYVAFLSAASDLAAGVSGTAAPGAQVYVRDRQADTTVLASPSAAGSAFPNAAASRAVLSGDGRSVAFATAATNLAVGVTDANDASALRDDLYVRDLDANVTRPVSVTPAGGATGNAGVAGAFAISADGNVVAFASAASDLAAGVTDANNAADVFVRDVAAGTTSLASVALAGGAAGAGASGEGLGSPTLSADGRYVAFTSTAGDLVLAGATNGGVFVRDRQAGQTLLAAADPGVNPATRASAAVITGDGDQVVFTSASGTHAAGDANQVTDVFIAGATPQAIAPDLTVAVSADRLPLAAVTGARAGFPVVMDVGNRGATGFDGRVTVRLVFSTDEVADAGDVEVATLTRRARIAPADAKAIRARVRQYPATAGDYFLLAQVDPANAVEEADESNNSGTVVRTVRVSAPFVDLAVSLPSVPAEIARGRRSSLTVGLVNVGSGAAGGTGVLTLTATPTGVPVASDPVLATGQVNLRVQPGATRRIRVRFVTPSDLPAGTYNFVALLEPAAALADVDPENDLAVSDTTVTLA